MGPEGFGGGVIIAIAAALWLLYLMPTWLRRRQFLATERNAVRLQQTLRVLAQTSEVPEEVKAELHARSVAEQHRALRLEAKRAEAVSRARDAAAARSLARSAKPQPREPQRRAELVTALAAVRLRRTRLGGTALLLASLVGVVLGVVQLIGGGGVLVLVAGLVGALGALALLQRVATVAAARRASTAVDHTVSVASRVQTFTDWQRDEERPTWTPVPLPRPTYLQKATATPPRATGDAEATLRAAAEAAEAALRRAHEESGVRAIPEPRRQPAPARRPAAAQVRGVPEEGAMSDLDRVLQRRRAAG